RRRASESPNPLPRPATTPLAGVILAGGRGSRMGNADKPLLALDDRCLIDHVIALARPQVDALVISANRHLEAYRERGLPVLPDEVGDYAGPLEGIATAMKSALQHDFPPLAFTPVDAPSCPVDLGTRHTDILLARLS